MRELHSLLMYFKNLNYLDFFIGVSADIAKKSSGSSIASIF